jgi:hypothetical protein
MICGFLGASELPWLSGRTDYAACAQLRGEPLCKIENDAGKKAGFGHTKSETAHVKLHRGANKNHRRCNQTPANHDTG